MAEQLTRTTAGSNKHLTIKGRSYSELVIADDHMRRCRQAGAKAQADGMAKIRKDVQINILLQVAMRRNDAPSSRDGSL